MSTMRQEKPCLVHSEVRMIATTLVHIINSFEVETKFEFEFQHQSNPAANCRRYGQKSIPFPNFKESLLLYQIRQRNAKQYST